jgi:integrase
VTSSINTDLRPLGPEERELLLSSLRSESDKIMLRLLLETGRSLDDLRGARVSDLDRDRGVLRLRREDVEEGEGEVEEISLSPELLAAVGDYVDNNPGKTYIFEGRCGRPVGPKWVRCTLLPAAIRSGLEDPRAGKDHE